MPARWVPSCPHVLWFQSNDSWKWPNWNQGCQRTAGEKMNGQRLQAFQSREETSSTPSKDMGLVSQAPRMSTMVPLKWALSAKGRSIKTHWRHIIRRLMNVAMYSTVIHSTSGGAFCVFLTPLGVNSLGHKNTIIVERSQIFTFWLI